MFWARCNFVIAKRALGEYENRINHEMDKGRGGMLLSIYLDVVPRY